MVSVDTFLTVEVALGWYGNKGGVTKGVISTLYLLRRANSSDFESERSK